jgi:hypothetical protein
MDIINYKPCGKAWPCYKLKRLAVDVLSFQVDAECTILVDFNLQIIWSIRKKALMAEATVYLRHRKSEKFTKKQIVPIK